MFCVFKSNSPISILRKAAAFTMLLALLIPLMSGVSAYAESEKLQFDENGEFKILIVADAQDIDKPQKATLKMLEASLDAANPDLVVFLGDDVYGNIIGNDEAATKAAIDAIIQPVAERNLPFALVFGNHDDQGGVSKETQLAYYQSFPNCMALDSGELSGCGNYTLPIYDSVGKKAIFNLWFFDSGTYDEERKGSYAYVKQDQIDWYISQSEALREANGGQDLPSFAFQHIPVPEIYDMLSAVPKGTQGAVRGHGSFSDRYYVLNPEYISGGNIGEGPCPPDFNSGEFDAWKQQGNIIAAFFGHDHVNDFSGSLEGIDLVMTPGTGFYEYGNGDRHGTRLITLHESELNNYDSKLLYYIDIVGEPPQGLSPIIGARFEKLIIIGIGVLLALAVGVTLLCTHLKKRRQTKV